MKRGQLQAVTVQLRHLAGRSAVSDQTDRQLLDRFLAAREEAPFAELVRGPDFVGGKDLERVQELWKYHWSPEVESALIERALYGPTLEEARGRAYEAVHRHNVEAVPSG